MDHHLGILQKRIETKAIEGYRTGLDSEGGRREGEKENKEDLNPGKNR
jgi:hypothetical protein